MAIINPWTVGAVITAGKAVWNGTKWAKQIVKAKKKKDWDIPKISKSKKAELKKLYGDKENIPLIEVSPQYSKHVDKVMYRGAAVSTGAVAVAGGVGSKYDKRKKLKKLQKNRAGTQTTKSLKKSKGK